MKKQRNVAWAILLLFVAGLFTACDKEEFDLLPEQVLGITVEDKQVSTFKNQPVRLDLWAKDSLPDSAVLSLGKPVHGTLKLADSTGAKLYVYSPDLNFVGTDSLLYKVCVGASCAKATIVISVADSSATGCVPLARADEAAVRQGQSVKINVLQNDVACDSSSISLAGGPQHGRAFIDENKQIVYTPNASFQGTDLLQYKLSSAAGAALAEVKIRVVGACTPGAVADTFQIAAADSALIQVLRNDVLCPEADMAVELVQEPSQGNASVVYRNGQPVILYEPKLQDQLHYRLTQTVNGQKKSSEAKGSITRD